MNLWEIFVGLGVPGLTLGIFYMLLRTFKWQLPVIPKKYVGPLAILFIIVVGLLTAYVLTLWAPQKTSNVPSDFPLQENEILVRANADGNIIGIKHDEEVNMGVVLRDAPKRFILPDGVHSIYIISGLQTHEHELTSGRIINANFDSYQEERLEKKDVQ